MAVCLEYQSVYCRRRSARTTVRMQVVVTVLLLVVLVSKVWVKNRSVDMGYELASARSHAVELDMKRRELELELSVLLRSGNLGEMAAQRLGLQGLSPKQARKVR